METTNLSSFLQNAYFRMLLTRMVDECAWKLFQEGRINFVASSRGHEAAQVGSALCIEVGRDFTLPYYRDLGVVLTIGMTPYEVFRTYLLAHAQAGDSPGMRGGNSTVLHWGYSKHNMVTGPTPVATQILHAAGIAFACKLRKAAAITIAYCGDGATAEADFSEGITFASQQQLPVLFICEQTCSDPQASCLQHLSLPAGLEHRRIDATNIVAVYDAMRDAMQFARDGHGPVLLEMCVTRTPPGQTYLPGGQKIEETMGDPLLNCQRLLEEQGLWDEQWASQLYIRTQGDVEQALQNALRDIEGVSYGARKI